MFRRFFRKAPHLFGGELADFQQASEVASCICRWRAENRAHVPEQSFGPSLCLAKATWEGPCGLASFGPPLNFAAMAVTLLNDLCSPVEVQVDNAELLVVYPKRDVKLSSEEAVQLRLREEPQTMHCSCTWAGVWRTSEDFADRSRRGRELDAAEQRAVARERQRRQDAKARQLEMIEDQAKKLRNKDAVRTCCLLHPPRSGFPSGPGPGGCRQRRGSGPPGRPGSLLLRLCRGLGRDRRPEDRVQRPRNQPRGLERRGPPLPCGGVDDSAERGRGVLVDGAPRPARCLLRRVLVDDRVLQRSRGLRHDELTEETQAELRRIAQCGSRGG